MSKEELQAKLAKANAENKGMVVYPEYFKKKKKRMRPDFIKKLEETAKADFTDVDDYGVYKVGSLVYRDAVVAICRGDGGWLRFSEIEPKQTRLRALFCIRFPTEKWRLNNDLCRD